MVFFQVIGSCFIYVKWKMIKWIFKGKSDVNNKKTAPPKSKNISEQSFVVSVVY